MVLCLTGIIVTSAGLRSVNAQRRPRCYMAAMVIWFVSVGIELMSLLAFPIKFLEEISEQAEVHWHFGWGYWVGWASAIFIFVSGLLLVIDKDAEELVYREITSKKKQLGSNEETEAV
ncbi:hypothetical protein C0Q70_03782 [Pomacea canaliculata]|uniref:Uncharacterized protein n=1 Tax=Pomacea canaliculata TaxID=400727 RepID=A0A2T7PTP4_POMCA|nr:hypothetical protein C0Q70_03782 [Pomacea canaliculata]